MKIRKKIYSMSRLAHNGSDIRSNVFFDNPTKVKMGHNCLVNKFAKFFIGDTNDVAIQLEDNVWVGMGATFCCVSYEIACMEEYRQNS